MRDTLKRLQNNKAIIRTFKSVPCADCGVTYPYYVMDFDHKRGPKKLNVSRMINKTTGALLKEIDKCEVVCANCHRIRTHKTSSS